MRKIFVSLSCTYDFEIYKKKTLICQESNISKIRFENFTFMDFLNLMMFSLSQKMQKLKCLQRPFKVHFSGDHFT